MWLCMKRSVVAVRRGAASDICPWWGQIVGVQNSCQEELSIVLPKLVIFLKWAKINGLIHMFFQLRAGDYSISQAFSRKQKAAPPGKGLQVWGELGRVEGRKQDCCRDQCFCGTVFSQLGTSIAKLKKGEKKEINAHTSRPRVE